jgi:hypothetical protein
MASPLRYALYRLTLEFTGARKPLGDPQLPVIATAAHVRITTENDGRVNADYNLNERLLLGSNDLVELGIIDVASTLLFFVCLPDRELIESFNISSQGRCFASMRRKIRQSTDRTCFCFVSIGHDFALCLLLASSSKPD